MTMQEAFNNFTSTMRNLSELDQEKFLNWIAENWLDSDDDDGEKVEESVGIRKLKCIAAELTDKIPLIAHQNRKAESRQLFIDEFLYDDKMLHKLRRESKLNDYYCCECGSTKIKQFELLSDSCSIARLEVLFNNLLGPLDGKTLLDVGSGVGAVIFGAHQLSCASNIIGVEMDQVLCRLSEDVLSKHGMTDRARIINADIASQSLLIHEADVIIVSNTFEHFMDNESACDRWRVIYQHIRPKTTLVLSPTPHTIFNTYQMGVKWHEWLKEVPLHHTSGSRPLHLLQSMGAYTVLDNKPPLPISPAK